MAESVASVFIENVKKALNLQRDVDLAVRLGVAKGTVASWRVRGSIPQPSIEVMEEMSGQQFADAKQQFNSGGAAARTLAKMHFFAQLAKLFPAIEDDEEREAVAQRLAFRYEDILAVMAERASDLGSGDLNDERILQLAVRVGKDDLTNASELRKWASEHVDDES